MNSNMVLYLEFTDMVPVKSKFLFENINAKCKKPSRIWIPGTVNWIRNTGYGRSFTYLQDQFFKCTQRDKTLVEAI